MFHHTAYLSQWYFDRRLMAGIASILMTFLALVMVNIPAFAESDFSLDDYAWTLQQYVNEEGMVDYQRLKAHRDRLDAFAHQLEVFSPQTYERWDDSHKISFWINAYNAFTLQAIVDHYPIKASRLRSLRFPKNSIRQISGVWNKLKFPVMGRERTLDEIEHEILRKQFNEPRIHMALVCAAMGCPPLRNEPYEGDRLDEQLDDQARRFLSNPAKFRIDRQKKQVYLSSIFKWFGKDFIPAYGTNAQFQGYDEDEQAVLHFISRYLNPTDQQYLAAGGYSLRYLDYDWSLNEQSPKT